jgi:hypothetical protein
MEDGREIPKSEATKSEGSDWPQGGETSVNKGTGQGRGAMQQGAPSIARPERLGTGNWIEHDLARFSTISLDLGRRPEEAGGSEWGPNLVRVSGIKKSVTLIHLDSPLVSQPAATLFMAPPKARTQLSATAASSAGLAFAPVKFEFTMAPA